MTKTPRKNALRDVFAQSLDRPVAQWLAEFGDSFHHPCLLLAAGQDLPQPLAEQLLDDLMAQQCPDGRLPLLQDGKDTLLACAPVHAALVWGYARTLSDRKQMRRFVNRYFDGLLAWHRFWYSHRDLDEDGLVSVFHPEESLWPQASSWDAPMAAWLTRRGITEKDGAKALLDRQGFLLSRDDGEAASEWSVKDVVLNGLLSWSNAALMAMGNLVRKTTVGEILAWHELATYSINEHLWDSEYGLYLSLDRISGKRPLVGSIGGFLPLLAGNPDQDQAEAMVRSLRLNFEHPDHFRLVSNSLYAAATQPEELERGPVSLIANWMLFQGLARFDFVAYANLLKKDTLALVADYGYYLHYRSQRDEGNMGGLGRGNHPLAMAVILQMQRAQVMDYHEK